MDAFLRHLDDTYAPTFAPFTLPLARYLNLPHLPTHVPTFLFTISLYQASFHLSSFISPFISRHYNALNEKTKFMWHVKAVSMVNAFMLVGLSLKCYGNEVLDRDRVFGWDAQVGRLCAAACAFVWDVIETVYANEGIAFFLHGLACLGIFAFSFRPFIAYYAPRSLIWEASTPFLNIHWWLDKTGRTGSSFQLLNGIALLSSFFLVRLIYGAYITYEFYHTIWPVRSSGEFSMPFILIYMVGNGVLNVLNWIWFSKMISAMTKRFTPENKQEDLKEKRR